MVVNEFLEKDENESEIQINDTLTPGTSTCTSLTYPPTCAIGQTGNDCDWSNGQWLRLVKRAMIAIGQTGNDYNEIGLRVNITIIYEHTVCATSVFSMCMLRVVFNVVLF